MSGYGVANLDLGVAITPETVFDVASVAKQFTAMSILLLAQRRQLALDDEVGKYIPDWGAREHPITIRHLLTHTSGLRDAFTLQGLAPVRPEDVHQQIVNILAHARGQNFTPGSRFEYNNGAYTLLGRIVQRVSGQPLSAFAEANIFKPLGMTRTHFHDDATRIVPHRATGYQRAGNGFRVATRTYTDTVIGNAGLFTTVGDLLRWEQNFAAPRVGDATVIAEMQKPAIDTGWAETSQYGFGLEIVTHRGLRTIGHGGGDEGRRAHVVRYPERGLAIAIACNLDDIDPQALARWVAGIYLADQFPEPAAAASAPGPAPPPKPVSLSAQDLQSKAGLYRNLCNEAVGRVYVREGKLMASENASDSGGLELTPIATNRFTIVGTSVVAEFVPASAGKPQEIHVTGVGTTPTIEQMITTPFTPSSTELRAFAGTYTSDEIYGTYTIVPGDTGLVLQIPTRSDITLTPVFPDQFGGAIVGVAKFSRDAHGVVTGFTATAPAIRGLRFTRAR